MSLAAQVWGRDDDGGGLTFRQVDIDKIVQQADHRGPRVQFLSMQADHGQPILNLCVSDLNKQLLLNAEGFIPLLVDSLLLDPEHPRMDHTTVGGEKTDWDATKAPVQRVSTPVLRAACLRI